MFYFLAFLFGQGMRLIEEKDAIPNCLEFGDGRCPHRPDMAEE